MPCFLLAESFSFSPSGGHFIFLALKNYNFETKLYAQQVGDVDRQHVLQMLGIRMVSEAPLTISKIHRTCSRTSRIFSWIWWNPLALFNEFFKTSQGPKNTCPITSRFCGRCSTWRHVLSPWFPLCDLLLSISSCHSSSLFLLIVLVLRRERANEAKIHLSCFSTVWAKGLSSSHQPTEGRGGGSYHTVMSRRILPPPPRFIYSLG